MRPFRALYDLFHGLQRLPEEEAGPKMKAAVVKQHADDPIWSTMPTDAFEPIYALSRCLVCDEPRYTHRGHWKRHLIPYGGTG